MFSLIPQFLAWKPTTIEADAQERRLYTYSLFKMVCSLYIFIVELLSLLCLCGLITNYHPQLSFDTMHEFNIDLCSCIYVIMLLYVIIYYVKL